MKFELLITPIFVFFPVYCLLKLYMKFELLITPIFVFFPEYCLLKL